MANSMRLLAVLVSAIALGGFIYVVARFAPSEQSQLARPTKVSEAGGGAGQGGATGGDAAKRGGASGAGASGSAAGGGKPTVDSDLSRGPHEIVPGGRLYYLGCDMTYGFTASYALASDAGIIVVDPGLRYETLVESLRAVKLDVANVKIAVITHRHADHWFAARELKEKTGATIIAHREAEKWLTMPGDPLQYYTVYSTPIPAVPALPEVKTVDDGDVIELGDAKFEVVWAPGHTPDSIMLIARIRNHTALLAGDAIMTLSPDAEDGDYMVRIGPKFGGDAAAYLATLKRVEQMSFDLLLPGHPLLGRHFDPVIGVRRWRRAVKSKIAALENWASVEKPEARIYLDGQPKQLAPRLYYLGEHEGTAGYVVDAGPGGLVCVDPAGRDRKSLDETLAKLDLKSTDVKTILLTGVHPSHSGGARALCDSLSAQLWCGPVSQSAEARERLKPDRELKPSSDVELGDIKIRVLAGVRAAGADLCYVVKTEKHLALLGGDSVLRFPKPQRDVHPELDEVTVIDPELSLLSIEAVMSQPIDLLLPAHPRLEQSPLFLPGEWQERFKRR